MKAVLHISRQGDAAANEIPPTAAHEPANGGPAREADGRRSHGMPTGMFSNSPLHQAMGLYLPATVAFRLINFFRIILLTWFMTQQQFGLLTMILAVMNVMTPLCSLGLNEAVTRYVPQHEKQGTLLAFVRKSFLLLGAITMISVGVICIFAQPLGDFFYAQFTDPEVRRLFSADAPELARLSAVVTALLIVYFYLLAVFKGLRMFTALSVMEMAHGLLFLALSIAAIVTGHLSAFTLTAVYGISLALPIAWFGFGFVRTIARWHGQHELTEEGDFARRLLKFSVWTTLAGITWQVLVYYPAWYLNKIQGQEAVAVFNAVRQIGQFVLIGAVAVVTVVMTIVTKTWENRGREAAQRQLSLAFRGTGLALFVFCAMLALAKDYIILMFRVEYADGAAILPIHLLFFLMGAYLAFLPIHFHLIEKTRHMFWPWAAGVAANVLYAFWLAGPQQARVMRTAGWQWAAGHASWIFTTGFSGPRGLDSAAWCGVLAIATSLALCVWLIQAECTRLDRGTFIVLGAACLLALSPLLLTAGTVLVLLVAWKTELVFSADERQRINGYILESLRHVPPLRALGRWRNGRT